MKQNIHTYMMLFLLFFIACSGKNSQTKNSQETTYNPNWPTVTLGTIDEVELFSSLRYGGYLQPKVSYPVLQVVPAVIRRIAVEVGQYVKEGDRLYSFQRVSPGTNYASGWVFSQNNGYVSFIDGIEGRTVDQDERVLIISDLSSEKLIFFLSNQHAHLVTSGQNIYIGSIIDEITELKLKINQTPNKATREEFQKDLAIKESLLEETKGRIVQMPMAPDQATGLFNVQVEFPVLRDFKIGRFLMIEIRVEPFKGIAVNQRHLTRRYGQQQVRVVRNGIVEYHEVKIGKSYGDMVVIEEGLKLGDKIIVNTNRYVRPGTTVNVVDRALRKDKQKQQESAWQKDLQTIRDFHDKLVFFIIGKQQKTRQQYLQFYHDLFLFMKKYVPQVAKPLVSATENTPQSSQEEQSPQDPVSTTQDEPAPKEIEAPQDTQNSPEQPLVEDPVSTTQDPQQITEDASAPQETETPQDTQSSSGQVPVEAPAVTPAPPVLTPEQQKKEAQAHEKAQKKKAAEEKKRAQEEKKRAQAKNKKEESER